MYKIIGVVSLSFLSSLAFSKNDIEINGIKQVSYSDHKIAGHTETVGVMKFNFSDKAKRKLAARLNQLHRPAKLSASESNLPISINLGMNGAPVLNQGHHGSCVTFSNTGALNAALGHGDQISQLCNLALGKTFEEDGYQMSGWNGSFGPMVLSQLFNFGYVSKGAQERFGCGGLYEYPLKESEDNVKPMPLKEFHQHSENLSDRLAWSSIISAYDWVEGEYDADRFLNDVKTALSEKHRVTFGMLLDVKVGHAGATGKFKSDNNFDTWMMTPEIEQHMKEGTVDAGHELVIYGYDDEASIGDQKGILFIRNSWSEAAGYNGDYFMTYDYFKALAYEAQKIILSSGTMPPPGK